MATTKRIKEITFGGSGTNNPSGYSWTSYDDYPALDLTKTYQRYNVIVLHTIAQVNLEVTALVEVVDSVPRIGPNDLAYMPCPPFC